MYLVLGMCDHLLDHCAVVLTARESWSLDTGWCCCDGLLIAGPQACVAKESQEGGEIVTFIRSVSQCPF